MPPKHIEMYDARHDTYVLSINKQPDRKLLVFIASFTFLCRIFIPFLSSGVVQ